MKERFLSWPEALLTVIRSIAFVFVLPVFFLLGAALTYDARDETAKQAGAIFMVFSMLPVLLWFLMGLNRRRRLKNVVNIFRADAFFQPQDSMLEVCNAGGEYLGIDTENGTLLYIRLIRRGVVDIIGLTLSDLTRRRVEGRSTLRLYTRFTDLPCITVKTTYAQHFFDVIGAMETRQYALPEPFGKYVESRIKDVEQQFGVRRLAVN
jgi:hypothetical protein